MNEMIAAENLSPEAANVKSNRLAAIVSLGIIRDALQGRWRPSADALESLSALLSDLHPDDVRRACRMYAMQADRPPTAAELRRLAGAPECKLDVYSPEEEFAHLVERAGHVPYGCSAALIEKAEESWAGLNSARRAGVAAMGGFRALLTLRTSDKAADKMMALRGTFCRAFESARARWRRDQLSQASQVQRWGVASPETERNPLGDEARRADIHG